MSPDELKQIRERCEAATDGEWHAETFDGKTVHVVIGDMDDRICECHEGETKPLENGQFIAHARTDIPKLLDALAAAGL